ncbi:MAG: hypothetical protein EOO06_07580 [Chitinophagaceae bacterium]|nr:MAG: hypothetical protein EOO06_07580 [Chitinophagaceae bacterium]
MNHNNKTVAIQKGQYLSEVKELSPLPSNSIIHKVVPGLGATHGEINAERHSIIILPSVPVIKSKVTKHNEGREAEQRILGIHKGVTADRVKEYLESAVTYKKILTTPEGYIDKLKEAAGEKWEIVRKDYYLLIDECERMIQDSDYRDRIVEPFEDFFTFTHKGLISATTLPFSDPRLSDFTHYIIQPSYNYSNSLTLIHTNSIINAVRDYFKDTNSEQYFIFLTSVSTITALIDALGIKSESQIYCSDNAVTDLKEKGHTGVSEFITGEFSKLKKFNFFTSRFYSGLDMELDYKPHVLQITDVHFAEHSILDPQTEIIQITGRFRNGVESVTHITNHDESLSWKMPDEARIFMDGVQLAYKELIKLRDNADNEGAGFFINECLTKISIAKYFNEDGSYRWCLLDNYLQEERVRGLYQNRTNLNTAYQLVSNHFTLAIKSRDYLISDSERLIRSRRMSDKELTKLIIEQLERINQRNGIYFLGDYNKELDDLKRLDAITVEAYLELGPRKIVDLEYSKSAIKKALKKQKEANLLLSPEILADIYSNFNLGRVIENEITPILATIYSKHGINGTVSATHIKRWFDAERSMIKGQGKIYKLTERKFEI